VPKLRKLIPLLIIAAMALMAVPVSATILPTPALYRCIVYENGALVGAGQTVQAFVDGAARGDPVDTNIDGEAAVQFAVDDSELGMPLSFTVDGYTAQETPDVDVSMGGPTVRLDYIPGGLVYTLDVDVSPPGGGSVSLDPIQPVGGYAASTLVELTATAASGYEFSSWSGDAFGTSTSTIVTMNGPKTVQANFVSVGPTEYPSFYVWLAWWM